MAWFANKLLGWLFGPPPRLVCARSVWRNGMAELAHRTKGETQESGAFLLGREIAPGQHRIIDFVFYDDIDANALASGVVVIRQTALPRLWAICRERGYGVVADIHVHPAGCWQSDSDQANPVMPRAGHIAMILPNFARGNPEPGAIGIYEFLGGRSWRDHSASGSRFVKLEAL